MLKKHDVFYTSMIPEVTWYKPLYNKDIHLRNCQFLSQVMNDKTKDHTARLLNKLNYPLQPNMLRFFSDEKNQMVNSQNNCWLALSPQDVPILMKTKHPVHTMVLGVITSEGDVTVPFIFPHSPRLNMEAYNKCLMESVLPSIKRMAAGRPYI